MRIENLDLVAFGAFTDTSLDLSGDAIQIVYGPNEAGKTTVRKAVTKLLYDFDHIDAYAFVHPLNALQVGATVTTGATSRKVMRYKRNKNPLVDGVDGTPISPSEWSAMLGGLSRDDFEAILTLGWQDLEEGTRQLLARSGSVGEAIFAAGLGVRALGAVLDKLDEDAGGLFKPTGKRDIVNSALRRRTDSLGEMSNASLAPTRYEKTARETASLRKSLGGLREKRRSKTEERNRLALLVAAAPHVHARSQYLAELTSLRALGPVPPPAWSQRVTKVLEDRDGFAGKLTEARLRLEGLDEKLSKTNVDEVLLEKAADIEALAETVHSYEQGQRDRGALVKGREEAERIALDLIRDLTGSEGNASRLVDARKVIEAAEEIAVERDEWATHELERKTAQKDVAGLDREIAALQSEIAGWTPLQDFTALRAALDATVAHGDVDAAVVEARRAVERSGSARMEAARALGVSVSEIATTLGVRAPDHDEVERVMAQVTETEQIGARRRERADELIEKERDLETQIAELTAASDLPSPDHLGSTRARRDELWGLVRADWLDGREVTGPGREFADERSLADAHETASEEADSTVDRLWQDADRTARRNALEEQLKSRREEREQASKEAADSEAEAVVIYQTWCERWAPLPLPGEPASLRRFIRDLDELRKLDREYRVSMSAHREVFKTRLRERKRLAGLLASLDVEFPNGSDVKPVVSICRSTIDRLEEESRDRKAKTDLLDEKKRLRPEREQVSRDALEEERISREAVLLLLGPYSGRVGSSSSAAEAHRQIGRLAKAVSEYDDKTSRIAGIERRAEEFETLLTALGDVDAETTDLDRPEMARHLSRLLKSAREADVERRTLQGERDSANREVENAENALAGSAKLLESLAAEQNVDEIAELAEVAERASRTGVLEEQVRETESLVTQAAPGMDFQDLEAALDHRDVPGLNREIESVDAEIADVDLEETDLRGRLVEVEAEMKAMDGSDRAAAAASQAEQALGTALHAGERYCRLTLARYLADEAIRRFRESNQDPMLSRAGAYLADLTNGRHVGLGVIEDGKDARLSVTTASGKELTVPEALSDGTRDQLYFALRLAAIEKMIEDGGPMPVVFDDVLVNFDDNRASAALRCLEKLTARTQVLIFTHHWHVTELAAQVLETDRFVVRELAGA